MPSVASPFGLKAKHHPSGIIRPQRWVVPASGLSVFPTNIYQDDAVYIDTNGALQVSGTASAGQEACVGSFSGVEYADSTGRRTVSNQFNKSLVNTVAANSGLGGISDVWFWLYTDPDIIYEVQNNGTLTGITAEGRALYYDQNAAAVNSVTGFSAGRSTTTAGSAASPTFLVYNLAYDNQPTNAYASGTPTSINGNSWSDAYPNVLVRLATPQFGGKLPAF